MKKIEGADPIAKSVNFFTENVEQLKALFPEVVADGQINFETLKQLLGDTVEERDEKYGLNWHGKRKARQLAMTPSTGTLRPSPQESVDWDSTRNLVIEGDNLEVLKLLQKSFASKVKFIYIDPPYNTGNDFVYPDEYRDSIKNYLALTGQIEGSQKISSNTESSGRYHTDWLNMMYPRLRLARSLLHLQGAILVSCDDIEVANLRFLMNEIFGEENFIAQFIWKARQFTDARANTNVSTDHEYILAYARSDEFTLRGVGRDETKFANPDNDSRGDWMSRSILGLATRDQRPNLHYDVVEPATGRRFPPNPATGWRYSKERMTELISEGRVLFPKKDDGRPREKKFRKEMKSEFIAFRSIIDGVHTANGTQEIRELFGADVFPFPKPTQLIADLIEQVAGDGDIVLDFFAGSGTTGHAVMKCAAKTNTAQRFILVQLPEPLDPANRDQKVAADYCSKLKLPLNLAELTKERLRRAAKKLRSDDPMFSGDVGFRVFKLDSSNIRAWDPNREDIAETLDQAVEHLKKDRSEQDILFELMLKLGIDPTVPVETKKITGHVVHSIGAGVLLACLSERIDAKDTEALAMAIADWHKALAPAGETQVVFRDSAFADDVAKSNLTAILQQYGLDNVRSL